MVVAVYSLYKLGRIDGKFDLENKKLERKRVVVSVEYADSINANYQDTGIYYVINEKESAEYKEIIERRKSDNKVNKQLEKEGATERLINVIEKVVERKNKPKKQ